MEISVELFDKICRACLCESPNMRSLFTKVDGHEYYLVEVFASASNSLISLEDKLPKQVCGDCEAIMCKAEAFKQRCNASATVLNNVYNDSIKKCNIAEINHTSPIKCENSENIDKSISNNTTNAINTSIQDCFDKKEIVIENFNSCFDTHTTLSDSIKANEELTSKDVRIVKIEYGDILEPQDLLDNDFDDREQLEPPPIEYETEQTTEKEKTYLCHCGISFKSKEIYRKHTKRSSCEKYKKIIKKCIKKDKLISIKNQIACQSCNRQFNTVSSWNIHQRAHKNDDIIKKKVKVEKTEPMEEFLCSLCSRKCKSAKSLAAHIRRHEENTNVKYTCEQCKREFKYKAYLDNHILSVHMRDKGFTCEYCMKCFSTQETLEIHREEHKAEKKHQCHICHKAFIMLCTLKDHMRTHTGEKPFLCSICGRGFSQKANLAQHMRRHQGLKPFKCEQCEKRFVSKGELDAHNRKHSGAHPFVCDDCGNGFTTSSALVKHRRTHTGERPYACDLCPMRFAASGTLKNHRRTHTGERPFQCSYCEKAFVQRTDLISHIRCHTGERPYICNHCGHAFRKAAALKAHVRLHGKDANMSVLQGVNVLLSGMQMQCDGQ